MRENRKLDPVFQTRLDEAEALIKAFRQGEVDAVVSDTAVLLIRAQQAEAARRQMEARLQAALREKDMLLKEVHHRVKNNLQIISSFLDLQAEASADPQVRAILEESQQRIHTIALIHDHLYQSSDLGHVNAADYLQRLSHQLFEAYGVPAERIMLKLELEAMPLPVQTAISCGLILSELLSNALKYAFPDPQTGDLYITLQRESPTLSTLTVRDTGIGLPEGLDFRTTDSLGLQLVYQLTEQLGGTLTLERHGGTHWILTFPITPA